MCVGGEYYRGDDIHLNYFLNLKEDFNLSKLNRNEIVNRNCNW